MFLINFFIAAFTSLLVNSGNTVSEHTELVRCEMANPSPLEKDSFPLSIYLLKEETECAESQKAAKNRLFFSKIQQAAGNIKTRLPQKLQRGVGSPKIYFSKYIRFRVLLI
ncbi:MAG: hypothetical protein MH137_13770 [Flavobacteriales bacterium]|nr:hypothetical protein [Flavobacteriales bacterium]